MSCADSVCHCADIRYDYSLVVPEINALQHRVDALVLQIEWFRDGVEGENELRKIVTAEKAVAEEVKYRGEMIGVEEEGEGENGEENLKAEQSGKDPEGEEKKIGNVEKIKRLLEEMKALKLKSAKAKEAAAADVESKSELIDHSNSANEKQTEMERSSKLHTVWTRSSEEAGPKSEASIRSQLSFATEAADTDEASKTELAKFSVIAKAQQKEVNVASEQDTVDADTSSAASSTETTIQTEVSTSSAIATDSKQSTHVKRYNSHPLSSHASFHRLNPLTTYSIPLSTTDKVAALASIDRMSKLIGLSKLHKALLRESLALRVKVDPRDKATLKLLDKVGDSLGVVRAGLIAEGVVFPTS
jgi:hypothetical protein